MLQSVDLPETLRLIIIEDMDYYMKETFNKVKEEYNAARIEWEMVSEYTLYLKL